MARICIISPGHLTSNPRLVKEADALVAAGHAVDVIHCRYLPLYERDDAVFSLRRWQIAATVPFGPLASPLVRGSQWLRQRCAQLALRLGFEGPWLWRHAWHQASRGLTKAAAALPADLYIAHYPAALPAAAIAAARHRSAYAFDAEDFHPGDLPDQPAHRFRNHLVRALERRYLPGCSYVTAASPGIAEAYANTYGIRTPTVVRNVFPRAHAPAAPTPRGWFEGGPSLYWFSQTVGPDRGLELAIEAIALSSSRPLLVLRGICSKAYRRHLECLAAANGLHDRLRFLGHASPDRMEELAAVHDLGFVGETGHTPNRRIALTNKLFSYALAGVPALISDIPAHRHYAAEAGEAVRLFRNGDPVSLAAAMDHFLMDSGEVLASARRAAHRLGQSQLNWERESAVLTGCVARGLHP